jgi:hypothetical protein
MPCIAGVVTEKNSKGEITHITIGIKKHKDAIMPLLEQMGVAKKSEFMHEFEKGVSVKDGFKIVKQHIHDCFFKSASM